MKPISAVLRAPLLGTLTQATRRNRSGDTETQRKVKIDGERKRNREIRGYKVKSLPPQRESAWSRRHHLLQSHSELLDARGTLALTGMPPEVEMGVG